MFAGEKWNILSHYIVTYNIFFFFFFYFPPELRSDSEKKSQMESLKLEISSLKEQIVRQQQELQAKTAQVGNQTVEIEVKWLVKYLINKFSKYYFESFLKPKCQTTQVLKKWGFDAFLSYMVEIMFLHIFWQFIEKMMNRLLKNIKCATFEMIYNLKTGYK